MNSRNGYIGKSAVQDVASFSFGFFSMATGRGSSWGGSNDDIFRMTEMEVTGVTEYSNKLHKVFITNKQECEKETSGRENSLDVFSGTFKKCLKTDSRKLLA